MDRTALNDRTLWFDGDSTFAPDDIADMVLRGMRLKSGIYVSEVTDEIAQYNRISENQLSVKTDSRPLKFDWNIPEKYHTMNVRGLLLRYLEEECDRNPDLSATEIEQRIERIDQELDKYFESNLNLFLRTAIYIVDTFREKGVVWGVGRGSSCSSYILYLIGLHDIDSVMYELEISDFLR
jgi:DNA polymerase III alpha subunit